MKLNISIIFLFFISFILFTNISCTKNSGITILEPTPDFILDKMNNGSWENVEVLGNKVIINNSDISGTYVFFNNISALIGIYEKENTVDYLFALPFGPNLYTMMLSEKSRKSIEKIGKLIIEDNAGIIIKNISDIILKYRNDENASFEANEIFKGVNITEEDRKAIRDELISLRGEFKSPKVFFKK